MQDSQETQVLSLGQGDPLEKDMAAHSSILAWRIAWTEESGRLQSMGSQRVRHDWVYTATVVCKCEFQPPSPPRCPHALFMSGSLFLLCRKAHQYHFSRFHIYTWTYDTCFSDLTVFCMTVSMSIYISTNDPISFLFMVVIFHGIHVPHLLYSFLCWWTFRLLSYFWLL